MLSTHYTPMSRVLRLPVNLSLLCFRFLTITDISDEVTVSNFGMHEDSLALFTLYAPQILCGHSCGCYKRQALGVSVKVTGMVDSRLSVGLTESVKQHFPQSSPVLMSVPRH